MGLHRMERSEGRSERVLGRVKAKDVQTQMSTFIYIFIEINTEFISPN